MKRPNKAVYIKANSDQYDIDMEAYCDWLENWDAKYQDIISDYEDKLKKLEQQIKQLEE